MSMLSNQRLLRTVDALAEACSQEMARDDSVFLFGLDVDDHKAIQGSTAGLLEKFGPDRIFGTPLSEDAMTGVAVGAAMAGMRPIHVHIRMDFVLLAMNQLINMGAKAHYMYNGQIQVPMVVRCTIGRSWGQGAQHSQALHSMLMHVPGLKVVAPTNAYDAKGLMIAAIRDNNPVIIMEHRLLCNAEAYVPEDLYEVEIGKARIMSQGDDITILGVSHMAIESMRAAKFLKEEGISAEVIDPVSLRPLDMETIGNSVQKTGKLLVVDNGWLNCGLSAEVLASIAEQGLTGPDGQPVQVARMGFADTTCPTVRCLEDHFYPNGRTIAAKAYQMVKAQPTATWLPPEGVQPEIQEFKGPF
ncbi:MAG: alpha-ketoacid dehydrogenase subunit beta [Alphaproteobacteria bacterium]|nr:alpha-ketoacid dehydrogenase subunit beta [Alphaproteobacteria bacterium]MDD9919860.1 alpha-ketoacid dehydrogenase subunit beta [Alphaproteobacteria bacterium]